MASKRIKENVKDKSIHRTAKNKSVGGKEKISKPGKTTNLRRSSNERRTTSKSTQNKEKQPSNKETKQNSETEKQSNVKTLIIDEDDLEGMTVPPKEDPSSSPWSQGPKPEAGTGERPTAGPSRAPPPRRPPSKPPSAPATRPTKRPPPAKSPTRRKKEESSEDEEGEEDSPVKQFSFPAYKILSGASVAPVQMFPQKVVIKQSDEPGRGHWGSALTGLFQNSKLTLKLRMLRLVLIWIFFRVLNKQTAWLSDMLGVGIPDEEPPGPKVKPPPGERFIKVFREGDPNPFHVRVKRPL